MTVMKTKFVWLAAVALWAIPTIAKAHGGNNDPNMVHVCIGNVSRVVRSVGVGGACISAPALVAETADHWPKQAIPGPKGDKGDQGIQGAQGVQGNPGTNGTNGIDGASVTFGDYFSGNQNGCPNGGAIYAAGNPPVNAYVCNGTNGIDGEDGTAGTRADGPCFDNTNRYVDCGNGTVTDTVTGLIWLKQSHCLPNNTWVTANQAAAGLKNGDCGLTDRSSAGDWRLPTKDEWSAMVARAVALDCKYSGLGGPPSLTNDAGTDCYVSGPSSFLGVAALANYWSSTSYEFDPRWAWQAFLENGLFSPTNKIYGGWVWPVRGGRR
jgi:hypothetical protein